MLCMLLIIIFLFNALIIASESRKKFFLLLVSMFIVSSVGIYYNLDGLTLMFILSELTVILVFVTMYTQIFNFNTQKTKNLNTYMLVIVIILNFSYFDYKSVGYTNYYSISNIILNDFYYIYNLYFEKQIIITVLVTLLITIYSIFFILFYFTVKSSDKNMKNVRKTFYLIRKQNIIRQSNYKAKMRLFSASK